METDNIEFSMQLALKEVLSSADPESVICLSFERALSFVGRCLLIRSDCGPYIFGLLSNPSLGNDVERASPDDYCYDPELDVVFPKHLREAQKIEVIFGLRTRVESR